MRRLWDTLAGLLLSAFLLYLLVGLIRPYTAYILAALIVVLIGRAVVRHYSNW